MSRRDSVTLVLVSLLLLLTSTLPVTASTVDPADTSSSSPPLTFAGANPSPPLLVEGLPALQCPAEPAGLCSVADRSEAAVTALRTDDALPTEESPGWWLAYSPDRDANGMDDRLQRIIGGEYESRSTTQIVGADGRQTVAIVVDYGWHPGPSDIALLRQTLTANGWTGEAGGAWFQVLTTLDSVTVDHVPVSALIPIWRLPGVVVIEQQNVMLPFLDKSVPGMKVRDSGTYSNTMHAQGYRGDGVVIAILDTGVDNEHRSLNDFDDLDDDPSDDSNEYSDPKFIAGFDATAAIQNPNNDTDPDDGNGHGTHVAGTALGTGDARRTWMGVAPGAYLIDVKVLTDAGGTNSQNSIAGLQWCTQNADEDWGNNDSSEGIDIISMSLGSASAPNSNDPGDDGTSAEARAANDAVNASIVVVVAMGNDGRRRVPSPASADLVISVAAIDDADTVDRADDAHASYSNTGPRESDGDDDDWDELKPDVAAPGSDIYAPEFAAGGGDLIFAKPLADDGYVSMDGTSMATPHVSGLVALMLQMKPSLDPQEIKDLLRNNSEVRGEPDMAEVSPVWDEQYGFGIVDGSLLLAAIQSGGGSVDPPPPTGQGGDWIIIDWPDADGTMLVEERVERIHGHLVGNLSEVIEEVAYKVTYLTDDGNSETAYETHTLIDWSAASGTDEWSFHIETGPFHEQYHSVVSVNLEMRARSVNGTWSNLTQGTYQLGWIEVTLDGPSGTKAVNGTVEISGEYASVGPGEVEVRIGKDGWQTVWNIGSGFSTERQETGTWRYDWDSTATPDGWIRIATRVVADDGYRSTELRRSVEIDNLPPTPRFEIGAISVLEFGMPLHSAHVNSYLEVRADLRNIGDAAATDVSLVLYEDSATKDEFTLPRIDPGDTIPITLYWNPLAVGEKTLKMEARADCGDGCQAFDDTFGSFPVEARPDGVDLALRPGAMKTVPEIPRPTEPTTFTIRIDNLGATEAAGAGVTLERLVEAGWQLMAETDAGLIPSASFTEVSMDLTIDSAGIDRLRITVTPEVDLDWSSNNLEFDLVTAASTLGGARSMDLSSGEVPVAYSNTGREGHLITSRDGALRLHRVTQRFDLQTCQDVFEESWAGAIATETTGDGQTHIVWTRRVLDDFGFTRQTLSYATIDEFCHSTPPVDLMPELLLSDGSYQGIDLEIDGDTVAVAGFHRDLFTGGTYADVTSIFTLNSDDPSDSSAWILTRNVIPNIDVDVNRLDSVELALGAAHAHLMYTSMMESGSGVEKDGVWYAHGQLGQENWLFRVAVADNSSMPAMVVLPGDQDSDVVVAAWRVGYGFEARLDSIQTKDGWSDRNVTSTAAPGLETIHLHRSGDDVQMLTDMVGSAGPQIHYGWIDSGNGEAALGQRIASGRLVLSDRAEVGAELPLIHVSSEGLRIRSIIDDVVAGPRESGWMEQIRLSVGLDANTWNLMMYAGGSICLFTNILLLGVLAARRRRAGATGGGRIVASVASVEEGEVELLDEEVAARLKERVMIEPHISQAEPPESAEPSEDAEQHVEAVAAHTSDGSARRRERRVERQIEENVREMMASLPPPPMGGAIDPPTNDDATEGPSTLPLPPPPLPSPDGASSDGDSDDASADEVVLPPPHPAGSDATLSLPPPPSPTALGLIDRQVSCPECGGRIKIRNAELTRVTCPICDTSVDL